MSQIILTEDVRQNLTSRLKFFVAYLRYGKLPLNEGLPLIEIEIPHITTNESRAVTDGICHLATDEPNNLEHIDPTIIYTNQNIYAAVAYLNYCVIEYYQ